jgi:hypothetical protein
MLALSTSIVKPQSRAGHRYIIRLGAGFPDHVPDWLNRD